MLHANQIFQFDDTNIRFDQFLNAKLRQKYVYFLLQKYHCSGPFGNKTKKY
jgi:hypothetical protein